jgi:hypothetical protein
MAYAEVIERASRPTAEHDGDRGLNAQWLSIIEIPVSIQATEDGLP